MNTKQLIIAAAVVTASASAFAEVQEFTAPDANFVSTKTRTEVMVELRQAQTEGFLAFQEDTYPVIQQPDGTARSRAEVRSEAIDSAHNRNVDVKDLYFGG